LTKSRPATDVPLNLLSHDREELIREWGFKCTCSLCSSAAKTADSDFRRQRINRNLRDMKLPQNQKQHILDKLVREVLDFGEKEWMLPQVGDFHRIIAGVYAGMGDIETARKHGELAVRKLRHFAGFDNERTLDASRFLASLG